MHDTNDSRFLAPDGALYWNEHGAVNCRPHAPGEGTDTWIWERWAQISSTERIEAARAGYVLACETCDCITARKAAEHGEAVSRG